MAVIPGAPQRLERQAPRILAPAPDPYRRVFDLAQRIQEGTDNAEIDRITGEANAKLADVLVQTKLGTADPEEYRVQAQQGLEAVRNQALQSAPSDVARAKIAARVNDNYIRAQTAKAGEYFNKKRDKGRADFGATIELQRRRLATASDAERETINQELIQSFGNAVKHQLYDKEEAFKLAQGIREEDSFNRALREVQGSIDPSAALLSVGRKYPDVDPAKIHVLIEAADKRRKDFEKLKKDEAEKMKDESLLRATINAVNGRLDPAIFDIEAKVMRYSPAEYNAVLRASETGGVSDPNVYSALELQILEGKITNPAVIAQNPALDRQAKSTLMNKIAEINRRTQDEKGEKHFSKTPEYQRAKEAIRLAVSPKGAMESLDKVEQQRLSFAYEDLWKRVEKGEDAIAVSEDLRARIARDPVKNEKPMFTPRFPDENELVKAFKEKRITREQFNSEALLLRQWQQFNEAEAAKAARPKAPSSSKR